MKVRVQRVTYNRDILLDQEVELGNITLITGYSGSGKTTLLKQVMQNYNCGYVSQDPDNQIVCDKVWHELAFGLENIKMPSRNIRSRVAEVATYLGIDSYFNKDVTELSGGQKQKVCLASVLCMARDLIILDEPTSMLDPVSSIEFLGLVERLSRDKGVRFLIAEHNKYVYNICDKHYNLTDGLLKESVYNKSTIDLRDSELPETLFKLKDIRKSYGNNLVVNIPSLELTKGINTIVGPNGSGKSTVLKLISGYLGKKLIKNSVLMPQDVKMMFSRDTVEQELVGTVPDKLKGLLGMNPLDLSGGEQHILGVYMTLMRSADIYCFDEPTKGMDDITKNEIMSILKSSGKNILMVSHDLDLVCKYSDKVIFLFNREIASEGTPRQVFESNLFYKPENVRWI